MSPDQIRYPAFFVSKTWFWIIKLLQFRISEPWGKKEETIFFNCDAVTDRVFI